MKKWIYLFVFFLCQNNVVAAKSTWSLNDLYQQALTQDETVQISQEKLNELRGKFLQIVGSSLPQIGHKDLVLFQDKSGSTTGGNSTFTKRTRPQSGIYLEVPLFKGFQEYHVAKLKKAAFKQTEYDISQEKLNLYADIARVYITLHRLNQDLKTTQELLKATHQRVQTSQKDSGLGKTLISHTYAEQAEESLLNAQLEKMKSDKKIAEETLKWMTGLNTLPALSQPKFNLNYLPEHATINNRPDLLAQQANTQITKRELKVSQAKLLPRIDADANYYHYRTGFQSDIAWDSTIELNLPLINAENWGEIKMNRSKHLQAILAEKQKSKEASHDLTQAYLTFDSLKKQDKKIKSAKSLAFKRFQASQNDYNVGLINNLDAIESQKYYLDLALQEHALVASLQESYLNCWLQTGQKP